MDNFTVCRDCESVVHKTDQHCVECGIYWPALSVGPTWPVVGERFVIVLMICGALLGLCVGVQFADAAYVAWVNGWIQHKPSGVYPLVGFLAGCIGANLIAWVGLGWLRRWLHRRSDPCLSVQAERAEAHCDRTDLALSRVQETDGMDLDAESVMEILQDEYARWWAYSWRVQIERWRNRIRPYVADAVMSLDAEACRRIEEGLGSIAREIDRDTPQHLMDDDVLESLSDLREFISERLEAVYVRRTTLLLGSIDLLEGERFREVGPARRAMEGSTISIHDVCEELEAEAIRLQAEQQVAKNFG